MKSLLLLLLIPFAAWAVDYTIILEPGDRLILEASETPPAPEPEPEPTPEPEPEPDPEPVPTPEGLLDGAESFTFAGAISHSGWWLNGEKTGWTEAKDRGTRRYSMGAMAIRHDRGYPTFFVIGHTWYKWIGEFKLPAELDPTTPTPVTEALQGFTDWAKPAGDVKMHGMHYKDGKLAVNAMTRYDASHSGITLTTVIENPDDLANSTTFRIDTPGAKSTGQVWISPIPPEHQELLGGDVMFGGSNIHSIVSRHSLGPSAIAAQWTEILAGGVPPYTVHQNFLYPKAAGLPPEPGIGEINGRFVAWRDREAGTAKVERSYRYMFGGYAVEEGTWPYELLGPWPWPGKEPLITQRSTMPYCVIVPETFTYACFGTSVAKLQGMGYRNIHHGGYPCSPDPDYPDTGGYCILDPEDGKKSVELFLFDIREWGTKEPHEHVPYYTGYLDVPEKYQAVEISAGMFDPEEGRVYLTYQGKYQDILAFDVVN